MRYQTQEEFSQETEYMGSVCLINGLTLTFLTSVTNIPPINNIKIYGQRDIAFVN